MNIKNLTAIDWMVMLAIVGIVLAITIPACSDKEKQEVQAIEAPQPTENAEEDDDGVVPDCLNLAPRPLTVIALNDEGLMLRDGDGKLYAYTTKYYIYLMLRKENIRAPYVLVPATE